MEKDIQDRIDKSIQRSEKGLSALNKRIRSQLEGAEVGLFDAKENIKDIRVGGIGEIAAEMQQGPILEKIHSNIDETMEDIRGASVFQLRLARERIRTLREFTDTHYDGAETGDLLNKQLGEISRQINNEIRDRMKITNRIGDFVDRNAVDITSIVSGLASNNPLATIATKFILDQWKERRREREKQRQIGIQMDEELKGTAEIQRLQLLEAKGSLEVQQIKETQAKKQTEDSSSNNETIVTDNEDRELFSVQKMDEILKRSDERDEERLEDFVKRWDEEKKIEEMNTAILASIERSNEEAKQFLMELKGTSEILAEAEDRKADREFELLSEKEAAENERNKDLIAAIKQGGKNFLSDERGSVGGTSLLDKIGGLDDILDIARSFGLTGLVLKIAAPFRKLFTVLLPAALTKTLTNMSGTNMGKLIPGVTKLGSSLIGLVIDGVFGFFEADKWGVSGIAGILGGALGGTINSQIMNTFVNAGKFAIAGAALGTILGPVGTIAGGVIGAILGGVLGWIGGEKIANKIDIFDQMLVSYGTMIKKTVNDYVDNNFGDVKAILIQGMDLVSQFFREIWDFINVTIYKPLQKLKKDYFDSPLNSVMNIASDAGTAVSGAVGGIIDSASSMFSSPAEKVKPSAFKAPEKTAPSGKATIASKAPSVFSGGVPDMLSGLNFSLPTLLPPISNETEVDDIKNMKMSQKGINFLKQEEGFKSKAYWDVRGYSIGYGHFGAKKDDVITRAEGEQLLKEDVGEVEMAIKKNVKIPLNQNQFDALVSFGYNLGPGKIPRIAEFLNRGDMSGAVSKMAEFSKTRVFKDKNDKKGTLVTNDHLVQRRSREADLFNAAGSVVAASQPPISPKNKIIASVSQKHALESTGGHTLNTVISPNTTNVTNHSSTTQIMPAETRNSESTHRRVSQQQVFGT